MKEKLKAYQWLFHAILAGVILVLALVLPFFQPERLIVTIIGLILIGFAGYRMYRLVRHPHWDSLLIKRINLIEMVTHLLLGVFLFYWIWGLGENLGLLLGYLLGAILIARGTIHFYSDQNKETNDDYVIFFLHIGAIIGGSYIVFQGDFTAEVLLGFIVVMATRRSIKYGLLAFKEFREKQQLQLAQAREGAMASASEIDHPQETPTQSSADEPESDPQQNEEKDR